jgi:hypothetical protein
MAQENGRAYTACILGQPVACAGMYLHGKGIGETWTLFSPVMKTLPLALFRIVSKTLNEVITEEKLNRVWAMVDPADPAAVRFVEHLGFGMTKHLYEKRIPWTSE